MNGVAQDQHQPHPTLGTHLVLKGLKMLAGWLGLITLLAFPLQISIHYQGLANQSLMTGLGLGI